MNYTDKELKNFLINFFVEGMNESKKLLRDEFDIEQLLSLERDSEVIGFDPVELPVEIKKRLSTSDKVRENLRIISANTEGVTLTNILDGIVKYPDNAIKELSSNTMVNEEFLNKLLENDSVSNLIEKCRLMISRDYVDDIINLIKILNINVRDWLSFRSIYLSMYEDLVPEGGGGDLSKYGLEPPEGQSQKNQEDEDIQFLINRISKKNLYDLL